MYATTPRMYAVEVVAANEMRLLVRVEARTLPVPCACLLDGTTVQRVGEKGVIVLHPEVADNLGLNASASADRADTTL